MNELDIIFGMLGVRKSQITNHKSQLGFWVLGFGIFLIPIVASAASPTLTYRYNHHLIFLEPYEYADWYSNREEWTFRGESIKPLAEFRVDGDKIPSLPPDIVRHTVPGWDKDAIRRTIQEKVASIIDREPGSVIISQSSTGGIVFEGIGLPGRSLRLDDAVELTIAALNQGVSDIVLPVDEIQPDMIVDSKLKKIGIKEVVTVGESDYSGSPLARKHNISVGLDKFNGYLIEQDAEFSFNEVLGPVNRATGYKKELVILGEKTLPEYGGGLCQISTTAYRGVWEYGFPISKRRSHSFAVSYYSPHGTDATIYPPHTDMKFVNDSPGALLIQTHRENNKAYYIYYGTKDDRESEIVGPYTWDHKSPPPDRTEYTTEIPPGTTRKVGGRVSGMKAVWYRIVRRNEEETIEPVFSAYQARPNYMQIGVVDAPTERPTWLPDDL